MYSFPEREAENYQENIFFCLTIAAYANKYIMKFAIISDIHISPEGYFKGALRKLTRYSEELVNAFIDQMNSSSRPQFVIQLGDAIEDEDYATDKENYKKAVKLLDRLVSPVYHVVGNHDHVNLSEDELEELLGYEKLWYSFDVEDYHFIVLFSDEFDGTVIRIGDHQRDWLKQDLKTTNKRTVVFVHHSLADQELKGNFWFENRPEECLVSNRKQIRSILESSEKVIAVFNGHLHWNKMDIHNSIPYFTIQSLVENTSNDGKPSNSYAIVQMKSNSLKVIILGNDAYEFTYYLVSSHVKTHQAHNGLSSNH